MNLYESLFEEVFGRDMIVAIYPLAQLKQKTHGLCRVDLVGKRLLVKVFDRHYHRSAPLKERACHNLFHHLPFVVKLPYASTVGRYMVLGYEWIDGQNIADLFNTSQGSSSTIREQVLLRAVEQIVQMVRVSINQSAQTKSISLSLSNPLLKGLLTEREEAWFQHDYEVVQRTLNATCIHYPGLFLDRNPGNIMYASNSRRIYQVDFGCIERTSPIFDLVQLLRTLSGEPTFSNQVIHPSAYRPVYLGITERRILDYAAQRMLPLYGISNSGNEDFYKSFLYACIRFHIYYLTKAMGRIRDSDPHMDVQKGRLPYHSFLLQQTFEELINMHEPVDGLKRWVERFTHFS